MSFSEDSATPAAPFSGDGSVFDEPDVLLAAPVTNERVVETQSGFLLVIRRMGERLALTCKRRVGTPPNSNILLTPDESMKLSRVLSASITGLPDSAQPKAQKLVAPGRRRLPFAAKVPQSTNVLHKLAKPGIALLTIALLGSVVVLGTHMMKPIKIKEIVQFNNDPLSKSSVEKFARSFVAEMLDFSADTYRVSQVHAMASMSPDLLQKYWKETNFPVGADQLKLLPQSTMVVIDRIEQQRTAGDTANTDVYAQLVRSDSNLSSPVHIKLKLSLLDGGAIQVVGQEDLTAETH